MKNIFTHHLIIWYAIILQSITGVMLLLSPTELHIARLGIFYDIFPGKVGPILELVAAILAGIGIVRKFPSRMIHIGLFLPQQFFLLINTGSALNYVLVQHYADGVIRSWQFIFLDQLPSFIVMILYLVTILQINNEWTNT